jgi:hypothetical protein
MQMLLAGQRGRSRRGYGLASVLGTLTAVAVLWGGVGSAQATPLKIEGKVLGYNVTVECTAVVGEGQRTAAGGSTNLALRYCSVTGGGPGVCKVTEPLNLPFSNSQKVVSGKTYEVLTLPEGTPAKAKLKLTECAAEGSYALHGSVATPYTSYATGHTVNDTLSLSAANNTAAGVTLTLASNPASMSGTIGRTLAVEGSGTPAKPTALTWKTESGPVTARRGIDAEVGPVSFMSPYLYPSEPMFTCGQMEMPNSGIEAGGLGSGQMLFTQCGSAAHPGVCVPREGAVMFNSVSSIVEGFGGEIYQVFSGNASVPMTGCSMERLNITGSFAAREGAIGSFTVYKRMTMSQWIDAEAGAGGLSGGGLPMSLSSVGNAGFFTGVPFTAS